jgi:hypothetical protein
MAFPGGAVSARLRSEAGAAAPCHQSSIVQKCGRVAAQAFVTAYPVLLSVLILLDRRTVRNSRLPRRVASQPETSGLWRTHRTKKVGTATAAPTHTPADRKVINSCVRRLCVLFEAGRSSSSCADGHRSGNHSSLTSKARSCQDPLRPSVQTIGRATPA